MNNASRHKQYAMDSINSGLEEFKIPIEIHFLAKIQLYLTFSITQGVEIFGISGLEMRALMFLVEYMEVINYAKSKQYRVFVFKEGSYFGDGNWFLRFVSKNVELDVE